ncbi:MAG: methyltransferase domain-containing protein, partial [Lentisphaeria bacterium]|nr:methyltransferase domain-containing protein [Lentisphaeria bacterium]
RPLRVDLLAGVPFAAASFDLIYAAMVLHHVAAPPALLSRAAPLLKPRGCLTILDLLTEDGSFHGDADVPHRGFSRQQMSDFLAGAGLDLLSFEVVHTVRRDSGEYPVFLAVGARPGEG